MILVTTGTHHQPFDRLVHAAEALARLGERVIVQAGASVAPAPSCERYAWLDPGVVSALADEAEVIVSHTGPASLFLAWDRGRRPIVVPRRRDRGEHVDDHQVRFAAHLGPDRAIVVHDPDRLVAEWGSLRARAVEPVPIDSDARSAAFAAAFGARVDALVARGGRAGGWRATLPSLLIPRRTRP
ncbi:MAG TPA: glycosyltransferase [Myxococcota bacterium]|nr:glycosyltransferase [Myxococcota bacterium]